ncbi:MULTISPECIES: YjzD family protein [unclassified Bacillus (in: firmicutes)]|uniref:YjzD family protein n=1 Tax=unclassified Bacillus (in: firmicutes) TaxID=185979 RepID=UPI0008E81920|nr:MULTISPECIES: YjzD family protein [unclassified Bacillus (in: firmicutes)]SFA78801.1 Protein of unknown function [Bacillus sp. UNCCL13]SFQ68720.1 Protein of unknown function [Bacillus sp. cl95]
MRYFWTFFWAFLLVQMLTYVASSMVGVAFDFKLGSILAVGATILILVVPAILPNDPIEKH